MWLIVGVFTLFLVAIGGYETWALKFHHETITQWIKRETHKAILVALGLWWVAAVLGYALRVGGR